MPGLFDAIVPLFAQDAGPAPSPWSSLIVLAPLPLLFYFMIYRPQKEQETKRRAMIEALKSNDKVVTAGGLYGTVTAVDAEKNVVVLRVDDDKGVKIRVDRSSILRVV